MDSYIVDGTLITQVNTFVPLHLQVAETTQETPDFLIQEWIDVMTAGGDPAAVSVIVDLQDILNNDTPVGPDPSDNDELSLLLIEQWNNLKPVNLTLSTIDNFSDTDFELISGWRFTFTGNTNITGIENLLGDTRAKLILNDNTSNLILQDQDTGSLENNRFQLPNNTNYILQPNESVQLIYDTSVNRWKVVSSAT